MKLTIEHEGTTVSITNDAVQLHDVWSDIIYPALLAIGFQHESVKELLQDIVEPI